MPPSDPNSPAGDTHTSGAGSLGREPPSPDEAHLTDFLAPPQAADELGRLGGYRVLKVLGHGGMGVVFEAEDLQLRRKVALKAMLPALAASETARKRFLREAQTAAAIEHDHIVSIYQVGEDRGVPFIAMPLLKGEPLDRRLVRENRLAVSEVIRIGRETAAGLAAAHQQGLIHRDIKPANLWLEESGRVKILDFGLARAAADSGQLTQSGAVIGTPAYMAPEQVDGKTLDARCDLFSLGCVLYRLSAGEAPFKGVDTISTLMAVATSHPRPPAEIIPTVPHDLSNLVMQLLSKSPIKRPASAQSVHEVLARMQAQQSAATLTLPGATPWVSLQPPSLVVPGSVGERTIKSPPRPQLKRNRQNQRTNSKPRLWIGIAAGTLVLLLISAGIVAIATKNSAAPGGHETMKGLGTAGISPSDPSASPASSGASGKIAQKPDEAKQPPVADNGYVSLYNGRDLTGWIKEGNSNAEWKVENGVLVGHWPQKRDFYGGAGIYSLRGDYRNFRFRIETTLCDLWACQMAIFAAKDRKTPWYQVTIGSSAGRDLQKTGIIRQVGVGPVASPSPEVLLSPDVWYTQEVVVTGKRIRVFINNVLRNDYRMKDPPEPGHLGIMLAGEATLKIRKIEVQELPERAAEPSPTRDLPGTKKGFPAVLAGRGIWTVSNGYLEQTQMTGPCWIHFGDQAWRDYDFSVDIFRIKGDSCWLGFLIDREKDHGCVYGLNSLGNHDLYGWESHSKPWHMYAQKKGTLPVNQWVQARVSVRAGHAQCFLNGQKLFEAKILTHSNGGVGLRTWNSHYRFMNIKVTDPKGKVLLDGLPELDNAGH